MQLSEASDASQALGGEAAVQTVEAAQRLQLLGVRIGSSEL